MNDPDPDPLVDEDRFLRLFVRHEAALRSYARVLVPTWDAVDEVMQEASVVMWRKLGQLRSANDFVPWAKVIVRFESLRARRKIARDRLVFSDALLDLLADESETIPDDTRVAEAAALRRCLDRLSSSHRELVLAPYAGSGQVKELAERSKRSANSLYKLLGRLRGKLQRCIEIDLGASGSTIRPR